MTDTYVPNPDANRRQVLYWRLMSRLFSADEQPTLEKASMAIVDDIGLPAALLDPAMSIDSLMQRFPELDGSFDGLLEAPPADQAVPEGEIGPDEVRRAALVSKLLINVFNTGQGNVSAKQLGDWQADSRWFRKACGLEPGGGSTGGGGRQAGTGSGGGPSIGDAEVNAALNAIEGDLVNRMRLREVLADPALARQLTPSMSLVEQLLRDKSNLSGVALANAKKLIKRFVDEVAEVLKSTMEKTTVGVIDRSVPPKRVFRNLDLQRTIWKNLTNWSAEDERLYVDKLFYKQTARRTTPAKLIVVVDQSGSMVDSMVNCTILASIFTGLPKVDVHLIAYDTKAIDLTPWVSDPFETLLRTNLGGGTDGTVALELVGPKIDSPKDTVVVWISDFYEWKAEECWRGFQALHNSGVKFIPVGSVTSGGSADVWSWFRQKFKDQGTPVLSGRIKKLVFELKKSLT